MSTSRDLMIDALKRIAIPPMRSIGFRGSFPYFRRTLRGEVHLLTFQFDKWGGGFIVEIGHAPASVFTTTWGKQILPDKLRTTDLPLSHRVRLSPEVSPGKDYWFRFDLQPPLPKGMTYDNVAMHVVELLPQAESWWADHTAEKHST
jgi:hypothetical protein